MGLWNGAIALGEGIIDVAGVYNVLKDSPNIEYSTLEVFGDDNLKNSHKYLQSFGAE